MVLLKFASRITSYTRRAACVNAWSLLGRAPNVSFVRIGTCHMSSSELPEHMIVNFPALSPTMKTGTLQRWNVSIGDEVSTGDSLADVETDKATMSFDSTEDGVIAKLLVNDGAVGIEIGQPVLVLVEDKADVAAFENFEAPSQQPTTPQQPKQRETSKEDELKPDEVSTISASPSTSTTQQPLTDEPQPTLPSERIFASPLARKLAERASVALDSMAGSGPHGRITKADVEAALAAGVSGAKSQSSTTAVTGTAYTDIPLSNVRKVIASRLSESKQTIPHYYLTVDICVDRVLDLRKQLNLQGEGEYKLSVNDFVVKASALASKQVKEVNSSWMDTVIRQHENVDVSIAVSTPSGLITPIVFDADLKGLREISTDIKNLAAKARENALKPEEFQGGTFTISNLGMFGIDRFTAIINPPQSCILAVGQVQERVVVDNSADAGFSASNFLSVTLSCDHRVVDGADTINKLCSKR